MKISFGLVTQSPYIQATALKKPNKQKTHKPTPPPKKTQKPTLQTEILLL